MRSVAMGLELRGRTRSGRVDTVAIDERVLRLEQALTHFERTHPDLAEALDLLGIRVEEFDEGVTMAAGPIVIQSDLDRTAQDDAGAVT